MNHQHPSGLDQRRLSGPEPLQVPIWICRHAAVAEAMGPDGELPVSNADGIEDAIALLLEKVAKRFQQPAPLHLPLRRQRASDDQMLLLLLPCLAIWNRDSSLGMASGVINVCASFVRCCHAAESSSFDNEMA